MTPKGGGRSSKSLGLRLSNEKLVACRANRAAGADAVPSNQMVGAKIKNYAQKLPP